MTVVVFGTYDAARHPRTAVLRDGLRAAGVDVVEINEPLPMNTAAKIAILRRPWKGLAFGVRLLGAWWRLWNRGRAARQADAVLVGYMGHFDVHLAARRFPHSTIVLDQLVFAADTARDRRLGGHWLHRVLRWLDDAAANRADIVLVDTAENQRLLPPVLVERSLVVPVGATAAWLRSPQRRDPPPLRVVFFGLYTPLQGAPVIGEAIRRLSSTEIDFTMIGHGQDYEETRRAAGEAPRVKWLNWVDSPELPALVAAHDVCLGVFGSGDKAMRVVPNKVYQGAAAGCAIVTSSTPPQRRALGDSAVFIPAGDASALATTLESLLADPSRLFALRQAAHDRAVVRFDARHIADSLIQEIAGRYG